MHRHLNRFKGKRIVALTAILGIVLITAGATYAWFSYSKSGVKNNTITSGSIKFHYEEGAQGLTLSDAMPMTDAQGMAQSGFDFTITSNTSSTVEIPYYVTVRRSASSETTLDSHVKVYLTKVTGEGQNEQETAVTLITNQTISKFSELGTYTNSSITIPASEKALYTDTVPINSSNYTQKYRLRMWIDQNTDFSPVEVVTQAAYCTDDNSDNQTVATIGGVPATQENCKNGYTWHEAVKEIQYPYNNKTYTLTVNVYSEGQIASAPSTPTVDPCPGCVYAFTTEHWNYSGTPTTLIASQYKEDYEDLVDETGKNCFLGFKLNNTTGTIERAYACSIHNGTPFCLEGSTDGNTYNANKELLNGLYGSYNSDTNLGCIDEDGSMNCLGPSHAFAYNDGYVNIQSNNSECVVNYEGEAFCFE